MTNSRRTFAFGLLFLLSLAACSRYTEPIASGTFATFDPIADMPFSQIRYEIGAIGKEAFQKAGSVNVIEDESTADEQQKYFRFRMSLLQNDSSDFSYVTVSGLSYSKGTPSTYLGHFESGVSWYKASRDFTFLAGLSRIVWCEEKGNESIEMTFDFRSCD